MSDQDKISKLTRIAFGGIEQLPGFVGSEEDYSFIDYVTFCGQKDRNTIKAIEIGLGGSFYKTNKDYDPTDINSFLGALNELLENHDWYLGYCKTMDTTFFRSHQRLNGSLYVPIKKKGTSEIE